MKNKTLNPYSNNFFEWVLGSFIMIFAFNFFFIDKRLFTIFMCLYLASFYFKKKEDFIINLNFKSYYFIYLYFVIHISIFFFINFNNFNLSYTILELGFNVLFLSYLISYYKSKKFDQLIFKLTYISNIIIIFIFFQDFILNEHYFFSGEINFSLSNVSTNYAFKNTCAVFLNLLLSIFLIKSNFNKKLDYFTVIIFSFAIIFSFSRTGLLLLIFNFLIILFNKIKYNAKILCLILLIFSSSFIWQKNLNNFYFDIKVSHFNKVSKQKKNMKDYSFFKQEWFKSQGDEGSRSYYIFLTFNKIKDNILVGYGTDSFKNDNIIYRNDGSVKRYPSPHNTYLLILYEYGQVGLTLFLIFFLNDLIFYNKKNKLCFKISNLKIILLFSLNFINLFNSPLLWFFLLFIQKNKGGKSH